MWEALAVPGGVASSCKVKDGENLGMTCMSFSRTGTGLHTLLCRVDSSVQCRTVP